MVKVPNCTPGWWEDPKVLITGSWLAEWKRRNTWRAPCFTERVNAITRTFLAVILVACIFALYNHDLNTTLIYSLLLGVIITLPDIIDTIKASYIQEEFVARITPHEPVDKAWVTPPVPSVPSAIGADDSYDDGQLMTLPSPRNPFMNVLNDEIKYNPHRPEAKSIEDPVVKATLDDFFRVNWYSDPTDVFGKSQSQRSFVTMPSTTVPSDRKSFQDWLYKIPGKTCKEGGREACLPGTEGGVLPWVNINR